MSSPSESFECRWQASRRLLAFYAATQLMAVLAIGVSAAPISLKALALLGCVLHGVWVLPRQLLLTHPKAWRGLRRDEQGWALWSEVSGWQPVQLRPDSMALPWLVILRYRLPGQWLARGLCVPSDALSADEHRRLRVRLKFSRRRWKAPE